MTGPGERAGGKQRKRRSGGKLLAALAAAGALVALVLTLVPMDRETRLQRLDLDALRHEALAHPNDPDLFLILGHRLRQIGEPSKASVFLSRAYDVSDGAPRFVAAKAEALIETGDYDAAFRLAREATARWPDSGELHAQLSRIYAGRGYFTDALREAEAAVRLAPSRPEAWTALGNACSLNKRPDQSFAAFERALKLAPRDAEMLADYGAALEKYGRTVEAQAMLSRAIAVAPRAARPIGLLGRVKATHARTPQARAAARTLLEQALARAPQDADLPYSLALLDLRDGRNQEAIDLLRSCLSADPRYGEAYLALGQAYRRIGRSAAARKAFADWQRFSDYRRESAHLEMRLQRSPNDRGLRRRLSQLNSAYVKPELARGDRRQTRDLEGGAPTERGGAGDYRNGRQKGGE